MQNHTFNECNLTLCVKYDLKRAISTKSKIKSQCHVDFQDIFGSKIVQVLFEKNAFKLDAAFMIFKSAAQEGGGGSVCCTL
jgi:hypothetical protein